MNQHDTRLAAGEHAGPKGSGGSKTRHVLLVDLNAFAVFPTLAVGTLVAALRGGGHAVSVLCPLSVGVRTQPREHRETFLDQVVRRVHQSTSPTFLALRDFARATRDRWRERPNRRVLHEVAQALRKKPDILLISAYLMHKNSVRQIGLMAREHGIPMIVGGPAFNIGQIADEWRRMPGITAIAGGEFDLNIPALVEAVSSGADLSGFPGLTFADGQATAPARPLRALDDIPIPDYSDFPWEKYPSRIIPIMTGRGCQWDKCKFCNDVLTASGRMFRTRSLENVLLEMQTLSQRHDTKSFFFVDLKLNSNPRLFRGLSNKLQAHVPDAEWLGLVHVDNRKDNGVSRADLVAAATGGMKRISFGLESGSQRLLDAMNKGTSVRANSRFIQDAYAAGLSVRCTMFKGFPGETAQDMEETARFLEKHAEQLDRVRFNEFNLLQETPIYKEMAHRHDSNGGFAIIGMNTRKALATYRNRPTESREYRRAKSRVLKLVHQINRKPLRPVAQQFDGLM